MDRRPDAAALATAEPFTTQTLRALLTGTENRVCSPMNLYIALAMLAETTGGQSRQQILELGLQLCQAKIHIGPTHSHSGDRRQLQFHSIGDLPNQIPFLAH